jgi:hypothetical protein
MPAKMIARCILVLVWMVVGLNHAMAQKASDIRIKELEFSENGYRYVKEERVWKKGVPTVVAKLECKKAIPGITTAKLYYFNADKKQTGISPVVNSYFIHAPSERVTGFANPPKLPEDTLVELHFAPPENLASSEASRLLLVIGTDQFVAAKMEPGASLEHYDFAEKALYEASQ